MIAQRLDKDVSTYTDELYIELLRLSLFDGKERKNPQAAFQDRLNNGDFLPVQPYESPNNLRFSRDMP